MIDDKLRESISQKYNLGYENYDNPLKGMRESMESLNKPHKNYRLVHVTGTKGAGSTSDFVASVLKNSGYKVGKFSGTGVGVGIRDKFKINGDRISEEVFRNLAEEVVSSVDTRDEWDIIVSMALKWFSDKDVDVAVFEAGVGGRWDSTNIISAELNILVNASVVPEHKRLGGSPAEVAYHKVGITEPDTIIVSNGSEVVNDVVFRESKRIGAEHIIASDYITFEKMDNELIYKATYKDNTVETPIKAEYLFENANTAVSGLLASEFDITKDAILSTLSSFQVPGRSEFIQSDPQFVLDGAHNEYAIKNAVVNILSQIDSRIILIFSAAEERWTKMIPSLTERVDLTILTSADEVKTEDPSNMVDYVKSDYNIIYNPEDALNEAEEIADDGDTIFITGDFTLLEKIRPIILSKCNK